MGTNLILPPEKGGAWWGRPLTPALQPVAHPIDEVLSWGAPVGRLALLGMFASIIGRGEDHGKSDEL